MNVKRIIFQIRWMIVILLCTGSDQNMLECSPVSGLFYLDQRYDPIKFDVWASLAGNQVWLQAKQKCDMVGC